MDTKANANTLLEKTQNLLTFKVGGQKYGIPVVKVVRIIEMVTITHLPEAPVSIQGLINLHGKAVPVMDLHCRFGLTKPEYGLHTPIVLVDIARDDQPTVPMGLVVDSVETVLDVETEDIELSDSIIPTQPGHASQNRQINNAPYLLGVAKVERQMVLLLDILALLRPDEQTDLFEAMVEAA